MTIFELKNKEYNDRSAAFRPRFICSYWERRGAWGHHVELVNARTGAVLGAYNIRYLNRTWERFTYQTAMAGAVEAYVSGEFEKLAGIARERNGGRLKRGERGRLLMLVNKGADVVALRGAVASGELKEL